MMSSQKIRFNTMERRPRMLKEFLNENPNYSCSFKSLPRKPLMQTKRSYSNSTFQTLVNTVMSIRRKLSRKRSQECAEIKIGAVQIKDIIRWKSFRDLVDDHHQINALPPLDFHRCATVGSTFTATTGNTSFSCSSCGSSWSDGDFFNSPWEQQNDVVEAGKRRFSFSPLVVGKDYVGPTEDESCQEYEQHSPVSVLQVGEDEFSPFDQSLANIQRRKQKFLQTVQKLENLAKIDFGNLDQCLSLDEKTSYDEQYEHDDDNGDGEEEVEEQKWIEERAKQLLHCVKATYSEQSCKDNLDTILMDFFMEELAECRNEKGNDEGFERKILRIAEDWLNGSFSYDIGHVDKDVFIKDMDEKGRWRSFKEEQQELALEIETAIFQSLVADLLDLDG